MKAHALARILVVEDEPKLALLLLDYLRVAGYTAESIGDGLTAQDALRSRPFDALLLDLTLPAIDGLQVCRELRTFSDIPVLMLTARIEEVDRLIGLDVGADDYICKPFSPREVVARLRAILRRSQRAPPTRSTLHMDPSTREARYHDVILDLTSVEFRLLALLTATPGRILSRDRVLDGLYDDGRAVLDRTVDSHIRNLRRKLASVRPGTEPIRSIYGMGYRWDG